MTNNDQLTQLYRQHIELMVAGDTAALSALLAPDFHLVHMTGMVQNKQEWLDAIASGAMHYHRALEDEIVIAGAAELIGRDRVTATIWGSRGTWRLQLHLHCVDHGGQLLIQHIEASTY